MSTYDQLEKDVVDLQTSMQIIKDIIHSQQEPIDNLENHIEESKRAVEKGEESLKGGESLQSDNRFSYIMGVLAGVVTFAMYVFN
jgi:t-SNARE complex subunit (syntaxin)